MSYVYPGTKADFYAEYGGLPGKQLTLSNILLIFIIVIVIIVIVTVIGFLFAKAQKIYVDHQGYYNLDKLIDMNSASTKCCVFPGQSAANQEYIYDSVNDITYSRQAPTNISTVCSSFPDVQACIADNTDSTGHVTPKVTFQAKPYYTFEKGQFVGCASVTSC